MRNGIGNLNKTAYYTYKEKIISEDELTKHLKSEHRLDIIHNNINRVCHKYHCNLLQNHCKQIASGQSIMHQGQEFDCVVKYLEHWKDHVDHRILPIHDINRIIERELERQIAHDHHHHSLDL